MEVSIKKNILEIKHKLKNKEIYKIKQSLDYQTITILKKPQICKGFSSRTEDNKDILLLDYDNVAYGVVIEDIEFLQTHYAVPHAYIFTTSQRIENNEKVGNYHVIFLSKHLIPEIITMLKNTHIDENFIDSPLRTKYRSYVLRLSRKNGRSKPKFIKVYLSNNMKISNIEISTAHKKLLSMLYKNIKHPFYAIEDKLIKIKLQEYETLK